MIRRNCRLAPLVAAAALLAVAGCDQYHMIRQQKMEDDGPAQAFPEGQTDQPPVPGTVARGDFAREKALSARPAMSEALLQRGHERFDIYCAPCHGRLGDGQGMVPSRGFPHPPSFHQDRLRSAPDSHFLDVIAQGYGVMYSYAARVQPADRWAILAYIRALQLSQNMPAAELPDDLRQRLAQAPPGQGQNQVGGQGEGQGAKPPPGEGSQGGQATPGPPPGEGGAR